MPSPTYSFCSLATFLPDLRTSLPVLVVPDTNQARSPYHIWRPMEQPANLTEQSRQLFPSRTELHLGRRFPSQGDTQSKESEAVGMSDTVYNSPWRTSGVGAFVSLWQRTGLYRPNQYILQVLPLYVQMCVLYPSLRVIPRTTFKEMHIPIHKDTHMCAEYS